VRLSPSSCLTKYPSTAPTRTVLPGLGASGGMRKMRCRSLRSLNGLVTVEGEERFALAHGLAILPQPADEGPSSSSSQAAEL